MSKHVKFAFKTTQAFCKLWYIPHHGVYHSRKNKLRVMFVCASKFHGTSLNRELLKGPDLLRFHLGLIALMTDAFLQSKTWFHGPEFLKTPPCKSPGNDEVPGVRRR